MSVSLKEFKKKTRDKLLEIHWKQWSALNVASHVPAENYWIIDLEALIISTLVIGLLDKRLLSACIEWLIKNGEWVNFARLKRICKAFIIPLPNMKGSLLNQDLLKLMVDCIRKFTPISMKFPDLDESEEKVLKEYGKVFGAFRIRDVAKKLEFLKHPSLLQLLLRGYFGVDAQVEVFIYLFFNDSGNSNAIAKNIFHNQRNIYTILERWKRAEVVRKVNRDYSLNKKKEWLRVLGLKKKFGYLNWVNNFLFFDQLIRSFSFPQWSDNKYSLSSLFRDLFTDAAIVSQSLNIQIPETAAFKGEQYFDPFATAIFDILERLTKYDDSD